MNDSAFGGLLFEYQGGGCHIALFEGGFRGTSQAGEIAARWEDVAYVRRSHRRVTVAVFEKSFVDLEIGTADGRRFHLQGGDEGAATAARFVAERTAPHLTARAMQQLQQPGGVAFSHDLRLSAERGVEVRKGTQWRSLPLDRIAGYKVTQGFLLIDENPAAPSLFAQLYLGQMQNPDALMILLDVIAPGRDLDEHPYRVGGSIFRTSAATHDPRYLSNRARAFGCLGLIGVGVLAGIIALGVNAYYSMKYQGIADARNAELAKEEGLRVAAGKALATAPVPTATVRDACANKGISLDSIVVFMAAADPGAKGLPADLVPSYEDVDNYGYSGYRKEKFDDIVEFTAVVRWLDGTEILPKSKVVATRQRARAHVRIFNTFEAPMICEGIAEGNWIVGDNYLLKDREEDHQKTIQLGLMATVLSGLCPMPPTGKETGMCEDVRNKRDLIFDEGPPPAPSASGSASAGPKGGPKPGKAPPK